MVKDGIDVTSVEGALHPPYAMGSFYLDLHSPRTGVPVLWWRSVGSTHTAYTVETIMDELAEAAGKDPLEFRRGLLADASAPSGRAQPGGGESRLGHSLWRKVSRAALPCMNRSTASSRRSRRCGWWTASPKVERVVCAVDCGVAINPDVITAQMEGGIGFGLGAVLHDEITLTDGTVDAVQLPRLPPLRINEMPKVEVHIMPSRPRSDRRRRARRAADRSRCGQRTL